MKRTHLLAATIAAAIALAPVLAEDTTKPEAADQTKEQKSGCMEMMGTGNMMGMDMGNIISNRKDQEAELDKLVADMNSAPPDKKVEAMRERVQKMMTEGGKEMMKMARMMMMMRMMDMMTHSDQEGQKESEHSHH